MGMCFTLVRLSDSTIAELRATPSKATHFWLQDDVIPSEPVGFFGRLFGRQKTQRRCAATREEGDQVELDKAWDALDYLISEARLKKGAARFLTKGGSEIPEDLGYGGPRVLSSVEVREVAQYLESLSPAKLRAYYDPKKMDDEQIYPQFWVSGGADLFDYVQTNYSVMKDFVCDTANRGAGIMIVCS